MKTKALISFAVTTADLRLFAYAKCWFSHNAAHLLLSKNIYLNKHSAYRHAKLLKIKESGYIFGQRNKEQKSMVYMFLLCVHFVLDKIIGLI